MKPLRRVDESDVAREVALMRREATAALGFEPQFDRFAATDELLYAHFPQIGSVGVLLERAKQRVHALGSAHAVEDYVWAYYRGFDLSGNNRIVITAVRDPAKTVAILMRGYRAPFVHDLEARFGELPIDLGIPTFSFHCMLGDLAASDAFDYEVNTA